MDRNATIERSNAPGKFRPEELRSKVRESREFWASPTGLARKAQLDRESRNRKPPGTPASSACRQYWQRRADLLEKSAPQL